MGAEEDLKPSKKLIPHRSKGKITHHGSTIRGPGNKQHNLTTIDRDGVTLLMIGGKTYRVTDGGALVEAESIAEKLYVNGKVVEKTGEQRKTIMRAINDDRLMRFLDLEQKQNLIDACILFEYESDEVVLRQGDNGDCWYAVEEGELEIYNELANDQGSVLVTTKKKGKSFGEGAMIYDSTRSGTVKGRSACKLWAVDRSTFQRRVLQSEKQKAVFNEYATEIDPTARRGRYSDRMMSMANFIDSMHGEGTLSEARARQLQTLYSIVNKRGDKIDYYEYALFNLIMKKPDAEYDIVFLLFDLDRVGFVSLTNFKERFEFQSVGEGDDVTSQVAFNYDCDLVKRFFGKDGKRRLRYPDFTQFFIELQDEIALQAFQHFDNDGTGFVSFEDFLKLVRNFGGWRIPPGFQERLLNMQSLNQTKSILSTTTSVLPKSKNPVDGSDYSVGSASLSLGVKEDEGSVCHSVSYAQFCAFNSLLNHLPVVSNTIDMACKIKGSSINRDDFKMSARENISHGTAVSPVMTDILFSIFDEKGEGQLGNEGVQNLLKFGTVEALPIPEAVDLENMTTMELVTHKIVEFVEHFALGAIAGGIGAMAVYPIDLVKTRIQNQVVKPGVTPMYTNFVDCFKKVITNEGVFALYRGLGPQLIGVAPEKAIKLTMNDMLRDAFTREEKVAGKKNGQPTIYFPLEVLAGCGAGASQVVFTNPLEIVKIRMQVQGVEIAKIEEKVALALAEGKATTNMVVPARQSASSIIRELGFWGLYRGAGACFLRDIPFSGIYFPAYAESKKRLAAASDDGELRAHHLLVAGAMAGMPAASLTTPADVIKTRLQVKVTDGARAYTGLMDCAQHILKTEGFSVFWKGAGLRVFRSSPQFGVTLLSYELLHRMVSPESEPRPPTNVPVTRRDFDAFRQTQVTKKIEDLGALMGNMDMRVRN